MKNIIKYKDRRYVQPLTNTINLNALGFKLKQKDSKRQLIGHSDTLVPQPVVDHVKNHLMNDEFTEIIRNSFGDLRKKSELRDVLYNYVTSEEFLNLFSAQLSNLSMSDLTNYLVEKIAGLDVLQPLADSKTITDIKIIAYDNIWVDDIYEGKYKTNVKFASKADYVALCHKFAFASSKTLSYTNPTIDAVFPSMRVNIVGEDLSENISTQIRKISKDLRYDEKYMVETNFMSQAAIDLLKVSFMSVSHLILGATATGKTEFLRYFARYTRDNGDHIMIEDTPETYLDELYPHKSINMWKNREVHSDPYSSFGYRYHIRNALRQNPDYIFLQESRGKESFDILDAVSTDHIVNTTLHGTSAVNGAERFIRLCQLEMQMENTYYGKAIAKGFRLAVHLKRYGKIRVVNDNK